MRALSADGRCVLAQATASTPAAGDGNERLDVFVRDLQEGQDMVEELARQELGMVKPNEVFVQITQPKK